MQTFEEWARALKRQTLRLALYDAFGLLPSVGIEQELAHRLKAEGRFTSATSFVLAAQRHAEAMAAEVEGEPLQLEVMSIPPPIPHTRNT